MKKPEAKAFQYLIAIVNEWRKDYHVNREGDVIFQNKRTLANVRFTDNSLHTIEGHAKGFEMIPDAIENPDEIWSTWEDPKKQMVTLRSYIKFGRYPFIVKTRDGVILDAFIVAPKAANKFRKGLPI